MRSALELELSSSYRGLTFSETIPLNFLTGRHYLPQTLFAIKSWLKHSGSKLEINLFDDGTIDCKMAQRLKERIPGGVLHMQSDIEERLDYFLPKSRFPVLRSLRQEYPHLRKLTDIHVGKEGRRIVSDTDVLVFRPPLEVISYLGRKRGFYMRDCAESYGLSREALEAIAGVRIREKVNCGFYCLDSSAIDWDKIESVSARILSSHGFSFYHEQALSAVLLSEAQAAELSNEYLVFPNEEECRNPSKTMLHYLSGGNNPAMFPAWRDLSSK